MSETSDNPVATTKATKKAPLRIILAPSALFYTAFCPVPPGLRARDLGAMTQGLVEEHSPLPIEQTSWGFLLDSRGAKNSHLFYYAAARDFVFKTPTAASDLAPDAVLPGLAVTQGLRFDHDTWLFLAEKECLSALFFAAGSTTPSRSVSRFYSTKEPIDDELFDQRAVLLKRLSVEGGQEVLPGVVRAGQPQRKGRAGIVFPLEQLEEPFTEWKHWKQTGFKKRTRLLAADIRDRSVLDSHREQRMTGLRLGQVAALFALFIVILAVLEFRQTQRQREAITLETLAEAQAPDVQCLQDIEIMTKSLQRTLQSEFLPFRWLMALNYGRPEAVSFTSFAIDDAGTIAIHGRSPEVKSLNDYVEFLKTNPRFASVGLASIQTDKDGAGFSLTIKTGDLAAEPPALPTLAEPEAPATQEITSEQLNSETQSSAPEDLEAATENEAAP